jgi:hypothetical protein
LDPDPILNEIYPQLRTQAYTKCPSPFSCTGTVPGDTEGGVVLGGEAGGGAQNVADAGRFVGLVARPSLHHYAQRCHGTVVLLKINKYDLTPFGTVVL